MHLHLHQHALYFLWMDFHPCLYISSILKHGLLPQFSPSLLVTLVCVYFFKFWEVHDLDVLLIGQTTIARKLWKVKRVSNEKRQGF